MLSQPISRQHLADSSRPGQDGDAHSQRASSQHGVPVHRSGREHLRSEWPQPHLWARQNTRWARTPLVAAAALCDIRPDCECVFPQMWVLQGRAWTTGRCRGSSERWWSSFKTPSSSKQLPSECPGRWEALVFNLKEEELLCSVKYLLKHWVYLFLSVVIIYIYYWLLLKWTQFKVPTTANLI